MDEQASVELDWLERDKLPIDGLDHLGVEGVSAAVYALLAPGISNLTERARYFALFPWALHRFAQAPPGTQTQKSWRDWIRRVEYTYAAASVALEQAEGEAIPQARATAVVGADRARSELKDAVGSTKIDLMSVAQLQDDGKPGPRAYFQNREGGYGQYYKGPLTTLGLLAQDSAHRFPDRALTKSAGLRVAEALEKQRGFMDFEEVVRDGKAKVSDLLALARQIGPGTISPAAPERQLLLGVFLGDADLCKSQQPDLLANRRDSFHLALHFLKSEGEVPWREFSRRFRRACLTGTLRSEEPWAVPSKLSAALARWAAYERNELFNYAMETLFWSSLMALDDEAGGLNPRVLAAQISEIGCGAVSSSDGANHKVIGGTVAEWIAACAIPKGTKAWEPEGTSAWADELEQAGEPDGDAPAWAVRVLGRVLSDHGGFLEPGAFPVAVAGAELHLGAFLQRAKQCANQSAHEFIEALVLEWVLFRHLRVATRKLAAQGVSTFKFRPEEGNLVLATANIPPPTFTSPRLRQMHRILADLGCISLEEELCKLTKEGERVLAAA